MSDDFDSVINQVSHDRRTFLRRLIIGTAFAVPIVSSFSMAGIEAAYAGTRHGLRHANQTDGDRDCDDGVRHPNQKRRWGRDDGFH